MDFVLETEDTGSSWSTHSACCQGREVLSTLLMNLSPAKVEILFQDGVESSNVHRAQAGDLMQEAGPGG